MTLSINDKLNITLCGMMGSGKSVIGKILANRINFTFIDIDKLIEEKANKSISKIFEEDGENTFRKIEEEITLDILKKRKTVVSLGGGSIINTNIRKSIKMNSYNVYLKVSNKILKKRLIKSKNRPLIYKKDINNILDTLLKKRENYYRN